MYFAASSGNGVASPRRARASLVRAIVKMVRRDTEPGGVLWPETVPRDPGEARRMLQQMLTVCDDDLSDETVAAIDQLLQSELEDKQVTDHASIPRAFELNSCQIRLWRGDITLLRIGAIVNAANSALAGCYVPNHPCVDNAIHSGAGPGLRQVCKELRWNQGYPEPEGSAQITPAFNLPSEYVIHTVSAQVQRAASLEVPAKILASCYSSCLDLAAERGVRSVAFSCIGTGMFGFPRDLGAQIALSTVREWLEEHPGSLDSVVFNVFLAADEAIYRRALPRLFGGSAEALLHDSRVTGASKSRDRGRSPGAVIAEWLDEAESVLVVAGAGMSASEGPYNVYVSEEDFNRHYPAMSQYGFRSAYECVGLAFDRNAGQDLIWGFFSTHADNQRWKFPPNRGYEILRGLIGAKDYFVLTSNVDGCFSRSGFDAERLYRPQGDFEFYQCVRPCRRDAVWPSRPILDQLAPLVSPDTLKVSPASQVPKCPYCGGSTFLNVRGSGSFLDTPYESERERLATWLSKEHERLLVLEIGCGFNTPAVTRFPAESITRDTPGARLVRINPSPEEWEVPLNISALGVQAGWQVLEEVAKATAERGRTAPTGGSG